MARDGASDLAGQGDDVLANLQGFKTGVGVLGAVARFDVVARVGVDLVLVEEMPARVGMLGA